MKNEESGMNNQEIGKGKSYIISRLSVLQKSPF